MSGRRITLDCDPNDTIKDVLQRVINGFQLNNFHSVQLLYKGKKLKEDDEIKSLNYTQGSLVIVHATDKKPQSVSSSQPSTSAQGSDTTQTLSSQNQVPPPASTIPLSSAPITSEPPPHESSRPPPAENIQDNSNQGNSSEKPSPPVLLPDPEKWDNNLQFLLEMGFDMDSSVQALVRAFNQPERAVELLTSDEPIVSENASALPFAVESPPSSTPNLNEPSNPIPPTETEASSLPQTNLSSPSVPYYYDYNRDQSTSDVSAHLPDPHPHPIPEMQSDDPSVRRILPNLPPTDPTIEIDEDFELIRQEVIKNPSILDYLYQIIGRYFGSGNNDENNEGNDIASKIKANRSLFFRLMGIPLTESFAIPDSFTDDDISAVNRLYQLGGFSWERVIYAYEQGERSEELASAILLSLSPYN